MYNIQKYINDNYFITENVRDKMKANVIIQELMDNFKYSGDSIINIPPNYKNYISQTLTTKLGLNKKRYNDGMYYFGLVSRGNMYHDCWGAIGELLNQSKINCFYMYHNIPDTISSEIRNEWTEDQIQVLKKEMKKYEQNDNVFEKYKQEHTLYIDK